MGILRSVQLALYNCVYYLRNVDFSHCSIRYDIMIACWNQSPSKRPNFSELAARFATLVNNCKGEELTYIGVETDMLPYMTMEGIQNSADSFEDDETITLEPFPDNDPGYFDQLVKKKRTDSDPGYFDQLVKKKRTDSDPGYFDQLVKKKQTDSDPAYFDQLVKKKQSNSDPAYFDQLVKKKQSNSDPAYFDQLVKKKETQDDHSSSTTPVKTDSKSENGNGNGMADHSDSSSREKDSHLDKLVEAGQKKAKETNSSSQKDEQELNTAAKAVNESDSDQTSITSDRVPPGTTVVNGN